MDSLEIYQFFNIRQRLYALIESKLMLETNCPCHITNIINNGCGVITVEYYKDDTENTTTYNKQLQIDEIFK